MKSSFPVKQNKVEEARAILQRIYPDDEVEMEMKALASSVEAEKADEAALGDDIFSKVKGAFSNTVVRRGLYAGITVQVAQQFVGINTVMYYAPTIVQFAGFASNSVALALSLITSGLNVVGSLVSMAFVDRYGRRRLMIVSMTLTIGFLVALSIVFMQASSHAPKVSSIETAHFGKNTTCPKYLTVPDASRWSCMSCLKAKCGFCANGASEVSILAFSSWLLIDLLILQSQLYSPLVLRCLLILLWFIISTNLEHAWTGPTS